MWAWQYHFAVTQMYLQTSDMMFWSRLVTKLWSGLKKDGWCYMNVVISDCNKATSSSLELQWDIIYLMSDASRSCWHVVHKFLVHTIFSITEVHRLYYTKSQEDGVLTKVWQITRLIVAAKYPLPLDSWALTHNSYHWPSIPIRRLYAINLVLIKWFIWMKFNALLEFLVVSF